MEKDIEIDELEVGDVIEIYDRYEKVFKQCRISMIVNGRVFYRDYSRDKELSELDIWIFVSKGWVYILSRLLIILPIFGVILFGLLHLFNTDEQSEKAKTCEEQGKATLQSGGCGTKYEYCLYLLKGTFSDLSDTLGNNTNNQDSISKTMQSEIDRCLVN